MSMATLDYTRAAVAVLLLLMVLLLLLMVVVVVAPSDGVLVPGAGWQAGRLAGRRAAAGRE